MYKYEVFGAHPEGQFYALGDAIDSLSGIGVDRIQARYFDLTSRWFTRAQRQPKFCAAVTLDPAHCAAWSHRSLPEWLRMMPEKCSARIAFASAGPTPMPVFVGSQQMLPVFCSSPTSAHLVPQTMWIVWQM
jgi:hypothetical protein